MLFAEAMDYFFDYCEMKELRSKTLIHYTQSVKLFVKWAQEQEQITEVDEVSELTIRKYIRFLQTRGKYTECINVTQSEYNHPENRKDYHVKVSNVTINNYFRSIRAFFNWLESEQIIEKTPFQKIRELPAQRKPKEYFTDTEVRSILAKFDKREFSEYRDMMAMILMLDSGMRLGETLSMEVEQIDLVNRSIIAQLRRRWVSSISYFYHQRKHLFIITPVIHTIFPKNGLKSVKITVKESKKCQNRVLFTSFH